MIWKESCERGKPNNGRYDDATTVKMGGDSDFSCCCLLVRHRLRVSIMTVKAATCHIRSLVGVCVLTITRRELRNTMR